MNHLSTDTFHPSVFCYTSTLRVADSSSSSPYKHVYLLLALRLVFELKSASVQTALRIYDAVTTAQLCEKTKKKTKKGFLK